MELLVAIALIGILATIAIPLYRDAVVQAEASALIAASDHIATAAFSYQAEHGIYAVGAGWGVMPDELEPYLPDGFEFRTDNAEFLWYAFEAPRNNLTPSDIALIGIRSDHSALIAMIEQSYPGQTIGMGNMVYLVHRLVLN